MNTNNLICIQLRKDGNWWVWWQDATEEIWEPKDSVRFDSREEAMSHAADQNALFPEIDYEIQLLAPEWHIETETRWQDVLEALSHLYTVSYNPDQVDETAAAIKELLERYDEWLG